MTSTLPAAVPTPRPVVKVTEHRSVDIDIFGPFWELYQSAFSPLATRAVARQLLTREEFAEEMHDERVLKFVAWDDSDTPIGLTTFTDNLSTVPWISPDYFTARFPDQAARNAIFYLGFTLVTPTRQRFRAFTAMLDEAISLLVARDGVAGYDICKFNLDELRFDKAIERRLASFGITADIIDTQTYYLATLGQ